MNSSPSSPTAKEEVFGQFFHDREQAPDRDAVLRRYCDCFPHWVADFREEAAFDRILSPPETPSDQTDPPYPDHLPDFRIIRRIAEGGMGVVYEAEQESLGRRVALKIRRNRISPTAHDRFLTEQKVLARLHEKHIVPIHTAGQRGPWQYFAMAYIEGAPLSRVVETTLKHETALKGALTPSLAELVEEVVRKSKAEEASALAGNGVQPSKPQKQGTDVERAGHSEQPPHPAPGGPTVSQSAPPRRVKRTLSEKYFRSVAQVMADAADALQHAHNVKILHRDVKPSNIMVDTAGQSWLIDFGLARNRDGNGQSASSPSPAGGPATPPAFTQGPVGTPEYMSPEQHSGEADERSDVWGLGVTLYELLTLRRAFDGKDLDEIRSKVIGQEPTPPHTLVHNIPPDLNAICRKATHKTPTDRYQTAGEFAADLRRWLRYEPTGARPANTARRTVLWARRNPGWAAAVTFAAIAVLGLVTGKAVEAEGRASDAIRESLLVQLQSLRLLPHAAGWSERAKDRVRQIADLGKDRTLADQMAANLIGIDAHKTKRFESDASTVAFDQEGGRLLMGGMNARGDNAPTPATLWDPRTDETLSSAKAGAGPVAFLRDGTPAQLVQEGDASLVLWNVSGREAIGEFVVPQPKAGGPLKILEMALAPDGSLVAASAARLDQDGSPDPKAGGMIAVWDSQSGKLLHHFDEVATALAVSPDAKLLAAGNDEGHVTIWSLSDGKQLTVTQSRRRNTIHCITFGRNAHRPDGGERRGDDLAWLLATGHAGGLVTIWDPAGRVQAYCPGSKYDVYSVAFSPDGTLLASAGRGEAKLWDAATGRPLLDLAGSNYMTGLAFSADGRKIAVCGFPAFGPRGGVNGGVTVWEVENGRGIETLRGLASPIAQVHFSRDGKLIAGLSQDWQVGIWEVGPGRLVRVIDTPRGYHIDNAGVAFSEDGSLMAFATGTEAGIWDIATGEQRKSVQIPPGLEDRLAFHSSGKLLLFRVEAQDGKALPQTAAERQQRPRVCQIRDLLAEDPIQPLATIRDFDWHVFRTATSLDGRYLAVEGIGGPDGKQRSIKAFDGPTGAELWSIPSTSKRDGADLIFDPTGDWLYIDPDGGSKPTLVAMPSGKLVEALDYSLHSHGPGATYRAKNGPPDASGRERGISLIRRGDKTPIVSLGIDNDLTSVVSPFNPDGTRFAWGNADGTVMVCEFAEVQRRLAELGMGW